jgi:lysine-specific demethylase 3
MHCTVRPIILILSLSKLTSAYWRSLIYFQFEIVVHVTILHDHMLTRCRSSLYTPVHVASIPTHRSQIIPASYYDPPPSECPFNMSNSSFSPLWARGIPLLVKDVLPRFQVTWSPEYFMEKYGDQNCIIVECQTDQNQRVTIKKFFEWFGKYENRTDCCKLKV